MIPIGELSKRTGVHIETIRYYEREGVLPKAPRTGGGRRYYTDVDVRRVGFIRHARDLGFDIAAVRVLLALQETPGANCEEVSAIARAQLADVESRITRLHALSYDLNRMIDACAGGCVADCRIIDVLSAAANVA